MMILAANPLTKKERTQHRVYHLDSEDLHFESALRSDCMYKAEIRLRDGKKRYYHCRNLTKKRCMQEVASFVRSIEEQTGESVAWKFTNEDGYRFGPKIEDQSIKAKIKRMADWFFDVE